MTTDPNPTTPPAGTGGAAERSAPHELHVAGLTLTMDGLWAGGDYSYAVRLSPADIIRLTAPAPDALSYRSIAPELPARSGGSPAPERVAGGAGLPTVEEMAEALYETQRKPDDTMSWKELLALIGTRSAASIIVPHIIQRHQKRAEEVIAILARLTPSPDRTADPVTENAAIPPSVTVSAAPSQGLSDGRVDAGAVREAAQTLLDACTADFGTGDEGCPDYPDLGEVGGGQDGPMAITFAMLRDLRVALDRAGDGWLPIETCPEDASPIWTGWDGSNLSKPKVQSDVASGMVDWSERYPKSGPTHWRPREETPAPPTTATGVAP